VVGALAEPLSVDGREYCPSVSIGIAYYPEGGKTFHQLMMSADQAMYVAKRAGEHRAHASRDSRLTGRA